MAGEPVYDHKLWKEKVCAAWQSWETPLLALILVVGAALRLYGLNWDDGHWLHPDERQIYFLAADLGWPHTLAEALSPASPLNPQFFAYGSLPIYLVRLVAALLAPLWPALRDLDNLHRVGRPLAALFDLGAIYLTYRLARLLLPHSEKVAHAQRARRGPSVRPHPADPAERRHTGGVGAASARDQRHCYHNDLSLSRERGGLRGGALLVAALVSLTVLHVQLAHFYTTDPLLTFFVMLTLNLAADVLQGGDWRRQAALGVALGLALATKVSAAPLLLVVWVAYHTKFHSLAKVALTLALAAAVFFLAQPYALIDWPTFLHDTLRESQIVWGRLDAPYTRQYVGTRPYLYSMWQMTLWGLGLPLGLVAWAGLAAALVRWLRRGLWADTLLLAWAGPYLAITGLLHTRYLRYMLPLAPILCLLAVESWRLAVGSWKLKVGGWSLVVFSLAFSLAFVSLYSAPHPWITASAWIYEQAPAGSTLAVEDWDTALPLPLTVEGQPRRIEEYDVRTLTLYDEPDDAAKWETLAAEIAASDYLLIASRRLYGSIPRLPDRYPVTTRYYDLLFAGDLGFALAGEFTRGPAWLNPRLPPLPDAAPPLLRPDESFVVYDHPRALIFRNVGRLPAGELLRRLTP